MERDINELLDEAVSEEEYFEEVREYIKKDSVDDIKELESDLHEFNKLYRKHAFDDDQAICKGYNKIIVSLKKKIKELKANDRKSQ